MKTQQLQRLDQTVVWPASDTTARGIRKLVKCNGHRAKVRRDHVVLDGQFVIRFLSGGTEPIAFNGVGLHTRANRLWLVMGLESGNVGAVVVWEFALDRGQLYPEQYKLQYGSLKASLLGRRKFAFGRFPGES